MTIDRVAVDAAKDRHFGESAALHRWPVDMQRWSDQQMLEQLERIERQLGTQPELSPHSSTLSVRPTPQRPQGTHSAPQRPHSARPAPKLTYSGRSSPRAVKAKPEWKTAPVRMGCVEVRHDEEAWHPLSTTAAWEREMVHVRYELFASPSPLLNGGDVLSIWSGAPKVVTSEVSLSTLIAQELAKRVRAVERDAHDRVAAVEQAAQKRINDLEQRIGIEVLVKALFVMLCNVDGKLVEIGDTGYLGSMPTEIRALLARFVAEAETKARLQFENRKDGIAIESRAATEAALQAKTAAEARAAKAREAERVATEEAQKLRDKVSSLSMAVAAEEKKTVVALKAVGEAKSKMRRVELELETANTGWAAAKVEQSKAVEKAWKSETKAAALERQLAALERQLQLVQRTAGETRSAAETSAEEVEALKYKLQQIMEEVAKANEEKPFLERLRDSKLCKT